ncbi:hypothetical protein TWF751_007629 [Orbilia oligospora]|nr:hypothetical protein TWF751_007629 [Orbilia oligospora]KAF3243081.1 hypothetical protein TWF128_010304 [Orbilia oligospora]
MVANCAAVAASCRTDRVGSPSMLPRLEPRQPLHPVSKAGFSGQPKLEIIRFYVQSYYKVEYKVLTSSITNPRVGVIAIAMKQENGIL